MTVPRRYTVTGAPRTKKTSQRIVKNKKTGKQFILPSKLSGDWAKEAVRQLRAQHDGPPIDYRVAVEYWIYREADRGDLSNFINAIDDALQEAGVLKNDNLIYDSHGHKRKSKDHPHVVLLITPAKEEA